MAELTPIPAAQRPSDAGYQPVSGYAVAAVIVTGAFAVFLLMLIGQAVIARRTAMSYELLGLPILGIILAAIARSHIRNAEGTRSGLKLATVSWWVCVLGGVGWFAYLQANTFVLERESARRSDQFFDELKAGKVHHAFVHLLPPEERGREDPSNAEAFEATYGPAGFLAFKNHELVRLIVRNGSAAELSRVGVKDVGQESAGFQATHIYKLRCPEGLFDVQVKLTAAESKRSRQPTWYIPSQPTPNFTVRADRVSQYGRAMAELEFEADGFIKSWLGHMAANRWLLAQLLTTPRAHREATDQAIFRAGALGGGPAFAFPLRPESLPADRAGALRPPDPNAPNATLGRLSFDDLSAAGFFRRDAAGAGLASDRLGQLRELWPQGRVMPAHNERMAQMGMTPPGVPIISFDQNVVRVEVGAEIVLDGYGRVARCVIGVECVAPELISALSAGRDRGPDAADDGSLTARTLPARDWRIAWLRTDMEPLAMPAGPGGGSAGGMGGPPGGPPRP